MERSRSVLNHERLNHFSCLNFYEVEIESSQHVVRTSISQKIQDFCQVPMPQSRPTGANHIHNKTPVQRRGDWIVKQPFEAGFEPSTFTLGTWSFAS